MRGLLSAMVASAAALLVTALGTAARAQEASAGKICYARAERGGYYLHVMDADGKNDRELPGQPGEVNTFPSWSPDGKQIAFMSGAAAGGMEFGVYVCAADGAGMKRLLGNEKLAALPAWSPDGKTQERITPADVSCYSPAWSRQ